MNTITIPYKPRELQQQIHKNLKRFTGINTKFTSSTTKVLRAIKWATLLENQRYL